MVYVSVACFALYALFTVSLILLLLQWRKSEKQYSIDVEKYREIVVVTTTNYLSNVFSNQVHQSKPDASVDLNLTNSIKVVVEDYGYWDTHGPEARLRGMVVRIGDLIQEGFIRVINERSIICTGLDGNTTVIKNYSDFKTPAASRREGAGVEEEEKGAI